MSIENFITRLEGKTLEFKESLNSKGKILATVIAFSNTAGGIILIGVEDKTRKPVGVINPHRIGEDIANFLHDSIEPRILPNIEILEWKGLYFIKIEIFPSSLRPHYERTKGKLKSTYLRIGSTTRLADADLIKSIERSVLVKSFDEEVCYETNSENIDFIAASECFSGKKDLKKNDLLSLNILEKDHNTLYPTVGGVLLFGKERLKLFPEAWIKVGYFQGEDKEVILSTKNITSYFPMALEEAMAFIRDCLGVGFTIEGLKNTEVWRIPKVALREALINAVVHNDFILRGSPIQIAIFSNRIEIENSGCLPWSLTIDDIKQGISKLRNPVIARTFFELGLIEQWGSGIRRMINACEKGGLMEPIFEEIGARIRVTFFLDATQSITMDAVDKKIIKTLLGTNNTTHLIAEEIKLSKRATRSRLLRLVELGVIVEIAQNPNDPKKTYRLIKKNVH